MAYHTFWGTDWSLPRQWTCTLALNSIDLSMRALTTAVQSSIRPKSSQWSQNLSVSVLLTQDFKISSLVFIRVIFVLGKVVLLFEEEFSSILHYYFTKLNLKKMGPLQFCLPVLLGIQRTLNKNIFFKFLWGIIEIIPLIIFYHLDKHLDGAWDSFWLKLQYGSFIALQRKAFGPPKIRISYRVKKYHFDNFSQWTGMAMPFSTSH